MACRVKSLFLGIFSGGPVLSAEEEPVSWQIEREKLRKLKLENDARDGLLVDRARLAGEMSVVTATLNRRLEAVARKHGEEVGAALESALGEMRREVDRLLTDKTPDLLDELADTHLADPAKKKKPGRPRKAASELKRPRARQGKKAVRTRNG